MSALPWWSVAAVSAGAAVGAVLRWGAGLWLDGGNGPTPLALGTLAVNCVGGLLVGVALVALPKEPQDAWRLLWVTGFLGGLTTFSAFSAESLLLLQRGEWLWALGHTLAHVGGGLGFAALGWAAARSLLT